MAGIPKKTNEAVIKMIDKMATKAGITHFDVGQIDVVHRTLPKESASSIIVFIKKSDWINLYY